MPLPPGLPLAYAPPAQGDCRSCAGGRSPQWWTRSAGAGVVSLHRPSPPPSQKNPPNGLNRRGENYSAFLGFWRSAGHYTHLPPRPVLSIRDASGGSRLLSVVQDHGSDQPEGVVCHHFTPNKEFHAIPWNHGDIGYDDEGRLSLKAGFCNDRAAREDW